MVLSNYSVQVEAFAERHYIKKFQKQYKGRWLATKQNIITVCERIDNMLNYGRADIILATKWQKLVKLDFSIAGTCISPKASGNRCILFVDEETRDVRILLVYSKNEICQPNETQKWKDIVRKEYADIAKIFRM
ncbi:MAG: hypothetical protein LBG97_06700 [Coriobacteriales bacterium]|jgi:hypothetical protein|nr:hypothetical protein [Coriobacteriales bacterium]